MDAYEATRVVFSRIQTLDPDNAAKIMGLLLIQDNGEKEMIRLAFGPETLLQSVILKAKKELGLLTIPIPIPIHHIPIPPPSPSSSSYISRQNSSSSSTSSRFGMVPPPPPLTISSPSWAPPPPPSEHVQCSSEDLLMSPNNYGDLGMDNAGLGWKPCLYFARGFCKNGTSCKFLHDDGNLGKLDMAFEQELLLRAKSQRLSSPTGFPYSPTGNMSMSMSMPISPSSSKCMNILLQNENQRAAAAAAATAAALMLGDESHKFMGRSRFDRNDFMGMMNPGSRQIYLTFPADSTFREEDVSNYFSIYGPVQDVRIPYQQKRMFGFVTFVYPETVKLILAKGNPHFVCDARVLVKPYKEKGKVPDKNKQQQGERGDFSGCTTPTGLDSRDPYDLQQIGARMMYNNCNSSQEMYLRRKLEEQQQAAELQQAIELQGRRFMGLQLLDFNNNRSMPFSGPISTLTTVTTTTTTTLSNDESPTEDKSLSPASNGGEQQVTAVNSAVSADKEESGEREGSPNADSDFQGSVEHNLPDSPFASPTKAASFGGEHPFENGSVAVEPEFIGASSPHGNNTGIASGLMAPNSSLDMASFNSCFFQMPRFASGHGAVGLYK